MVRVHAAIGLLSAALIAFQLVLMHVLSIVQWHHFVYMVISVALLGFGAAGTVIALARRWLLHRFDVLVPVLMMISGMAMAAVVSLSLTSFARFDTLLLFSSRSQLWLLLLNYLFYFIPFFFGAMAIGLIFVKYANEIGGLYFSNLLGSGIGGLLGILLFRLFMPEQLPALTGVIAFGAGILVFSSRYRVTLWLTISLTLGTITYFLLIPPRLTYSQYKDVSYVLTLPEADVLVERNSPQGFVQIVSSPSLRYAPGLSLSFQGEVPSQVAVFNNGDWFGAITSWNPEQREHILDFTTAGLPYELSRPLTALFFSAGAGDPVAQALSNGVLRVDYVEPHVTIVSLLKSNFAVMNRRVLTHPAVTHHAVEPRTFLFANRSYYDLIVFPTVGTMRGEAGLFALQEKYLLTREAFEEALNRLHPGGYLAITVWMDYPYRAPLRTLATLVEAALSIGISHPAEHIAAVRSWGTVTFVLKKSPLTRAEVERVYTFCDQYGFDPAILPGLDLTRRSENNRLEDEQFFRYLDEILSKGREKLYETYDFEITPPSDDRPFFSQFMRWKSIPRIFAQFGNQAYPLLEVGYLVAIVTLVQITLAALILILLPLLVLGRHRPGTLWTLIYFGGLGLGYMLFEIVLIQRFTLYLGHPIFAAAAVLAAMLMCSGIGSLISSRLKVRRTTLVIAAGVVVVLLSMYSVVLAWLLRTSMTLPFGLKAISSFILIAPPAIVMGMPFPLGIRYLASNDEPQVPWAWGINGAISVLGSVLAVILAVEVGFSIVMLIAAGSYALVCITALRS